MAPRACVTCRSWPDGSCSCGATSPPLHPDLLAGLPDGVTVCEWGYEDNHPFDERAARLTAAGVPFWVCPGTSSWMSISGRVDNMLGNIRAAAVAGVAHGADGLLVTDWGDMGHHQQPLVSDPGFATAAALAWCVEAHAELDADALADAARRPLLRRPRRRTGRAVVGPRPGLPDGGAPTAEHVGPGAARPAPPVARGHGRHRRPHRRRPRRRGRRSRRHVRRSCRGPPRRGDGGLVSTKSRATVGLLRLACRDALLRIAGDGSLASVPGADRAALAAELGAYIEEYRRLWLKRFRPGGLTDSMAWFEHLLDCYRTGRGRSVLVRPLRVGRGLATGIGHR